ncbi:TatD family hydrolase [bacterium]|nr:TatD family hydrolase [bacterium]MBP9807966.1 TatD family hydrolase [bacterium]
MSTTKKTKEKPIAPQSPVGIIDSHAHVVNEYFQGEREETLERAFASGVHTLINPAVSVEGLDELLDLIERRPNINVYGAAGQHPHEAKHWCDSHKEKVLAALKHKKMVAVGECGLDFYYNNSSRDEQLKAFREQITIAVELDKPVIVHCRDAWEETFALLGEAHGKVRGVFHCFTGGPEHLEAIAKLDFYVSFSGILTYSKATNIQEAAALVPQDRMLVETDCPFLSPQKVRGERNEPAFVWWTADKLATLRGSSLDETAAQVSANTKALFRLP